MELPASALVVGLARSGRAAALALAARGVRVRAADRSPSADPGRLGEAGVEVRLGSEEESLLDGIELLVKSPGVPGEAPPVAAARARGVPVWSEVELGWRLLRPRPFVGVTGTKGKTTTTELLGAMFRAAGRPVAVGGNVGTPLTSLEPAGGRLGRSAELSSFQLEDVHELALDVAVLLNLEPDHLDRHGTFERYRAAKLRVFERARDTRRAARLRARRASSSPPRTRCRPSRASPGPQPRQRGRRDGRGPRWPGIGDAAIARGARHASPASRTGWSSSASATACAGSTTRSRPTRSPSAAAWPRTTRPCG